MTNAGAPTKEVDTALAQFACARTCQEKFQPFCFNQAMYFIKKRRQFLDFINNNGARIAACFFNIVGISCYARECVARKKVKNVCVR